ncbi:hypothetical protein I302_104943 [Kwoniella bestiolae CBS 10118]|uniref:Uncharacterized protein n=1 Tax=Kwoniella bestiolae CBS 10118 TaxID=1296100 RepID=A0A1B9FRC1_9TREE|nr:hypothetical protein I302_08987 [Kwoniella bestiolae CBS 10118]OCF21314.1 hypothetical protein I302_08987 [Kwoniella bestiolae CBS 10118]
MSSFALAPALITLLPLAKAHMSLWIDSMYGFDQSYEPVTPMAGLSFDQWWFHGYANDQPSAVTTLIPGNDLTVEIACQKGYTSYGGNPTSDACPGDSGSYHAGGSTGSGSGWSGNSESNLMGCALAIAFKPTASQTNPEDFTVMSIQENCVRQRQTSFSIPNNLPACPEGGCTCAWFWQGKNSANEMYMTGFRCDVQGGAAGGSYPQPVPPRKGAISGPTQPMYWANTPTNLDYTPDWETKPSYNSAWGWTNGAQTGAFGAATGGGGSSNSTAGGGTSTKTGKGPTSTSAGGYGSSPSSTTAYGNGNDDEYDSPSSTAYGAPTSTQAWNDNDDGADGEYAQSTSSSTRGRRPRPTQTQSYDEEVSYGGEDGEEKPSWQELAADPIETGTDSSDAGAGEQALVETGSGSPKKCNRHNRRSRLRTRAKKSHV